MMLRIAHNEILFTLIIFIAGCSTIQPAQDRSDGVPRADHLMRTTMETYHLPSLSVAVSSHGKVVYSRAIGLADEASDRQATQMTVYAQGSVTKVLTAVAAMMLAENGDLDLDAPVQRYCPSYPQKQAKITLRQLLAHTAGVRHYNYRQFQKDYLNNVTYESISGALAKFKDDPLVAVPGETYHYSSWGYVVVACCLEAASGQSFDELIAEKIFDPAGMKHSLIDRPSLSLSSRATGYSLQDDGSRTVTGVQNPSDRYGASGLLSTPGDLVRFSNALLDGRLISQRSIDAMWSPQVLTNGESSEHGLGWDLDEPFHAVAKGGTAYDATSYLYIVPSNELVIAISTNLALWDEGRSELAQELVRIFDVDHD